MTIIQRKLFVATLLLTSSSFVSAQQQYYDFGFIGGSTVFGQSVFSVNDEASFSVEPNLFYNGKYGFIDGSLVNVSILPYFGVSGNWRFAQVSNDLDDIPSGITNRDGNGELGVTLGTVGARLTYLHDVTNEHRGYELQLHLGRTLSLPFDHLTITPYVEVDYRDRKLSEHLYSVSEHESSRSGLEQYRSESSWVYQAGLIGLYTLSENWIGLGKLEFEHHNNASPLIQHDLGWSASIGITYKFTQ